MKNFLAVRRSFISFLTLGLVLSLTGAALAAPRSGGMQKQLGSRPDNGQVLRVSVTLNGNLTPGVRIKVAVSDGSVIASGLTGKTGVYIVTLDAGIYTVTATGPKGTATSPVTIVQSTDPALILLTLAPGKK